MAEVQATFQCSVCDEQANSNPTMINPRLPEYVVCKDCAKDGVVPQIEAALKHEVSYPPSFGNVRIDYNQFLHLLPDGFQSQYRKKVAEYVTPVVKRVYCKIQRSKDSENSLMEECGVFLGVRHSTEFGLRYVCPQCPDFWTCSHCCQAFPKGTSHRCEPTEENTDEADDLKALRCPNEDCRMPIEPKEACNALKCPSASCRLEFCNVCRQPAEHDSDHWKEGNPCPRFGKMGEDRAIFDPREDEAEDEAEEIGIRQVEADAHPVPRVDVVNIELANWRDRAWNAPLVRDETFVLDVLRTEFGEPQLGVPDDFTIMLFLTEMRFALPNMALWRGVGLHLNRDNMEILLNNVTRRLNDLIGLRGQVPDEFLGRYPALLPAYERNAEKMRDIISDLTIFLQGEQQDPLGLQFHGPLRLPEPEEIAVFRNHRISFENLRQMFVNRGDHQNVIDGVDIAIAAMRIIEFNLEVPDEFARRPRSRWALTVYFLDHHYELQPLLDAYRMINMINPAPTVNFDVYEEVARTFMALLPPRAMMLYRRGWHPNGLQNGRGLL